MKLLSKPLSELLCALDSPMRDENAGDCRVLGVCDDSRRVQAGDLFVAVPGSIDRAAQYARAAVTAGAVAVVAPVALDLPVPTFVVDDARCALAQLAAAFYGRPTADLLTVGVTGTNGKTSVCQFIAQLFGEQRTARIDTVANATDDPEALTTPTSPTIQRIAWEALQSGKTHLVIEASSAGLAQHRLDQVAFDVAAFTNLSYEHMDVHGTEADYLRAKKTLFEGLATGGLAVINRDDAQAESFRRATQAQVTTYGFGDEADVWASGVQSSGRSSAFTLGFRGITIPVTLQVPGTFAVRNALTAACVVLHHGVRLDELARRMPALRAPEGRTQGFKRAGRPDAVVDFAHNPDGLENVLGWLRQAYARVTVVFGCPGGSDREKRIRMGVVANRLADTIVITSDNPKSEAPEEIAADILLGIDPGKATVVVDRSAAVDAAIRQTAIDGVVLLAGKGHETVQKVGDRAIPYSDARVLREAGYGEWANPETESKERSA